MSKIMDSLAKTFRWKISLSLGSIFIVFVIAAIIIDPRAFDAGAIAFLLIGAFLVKVGLYGYTKHKHRGGI